MTPAKCPSHELRPGELADSPRYSRALVDSLRCPHCQLLAAVADERWRVVVWLRSMAEKIRTVGGYRTGVLLNLAARIEHGEHALAAGELPPTLDVDGYVDSKGVLYIGKAERQPDGTWRALANVGGALCIVECRITPAPATGSREHSQ